MPIIGLGVYQNSSCIPACDAALKYGYRHIDTAQMYRNEGDVGKAVKESGVPREEVFISTCLLIEASALTLTDTSRSDEGHTRFAWVQVDTCNRRAEPSEY